jgi:hypothetical protein
VQRVARRFYETRGFVASEFNDGSHNEERKPDGLYKGDRVYSSSNDLCFDGIQQTARSVPILYVSVAHMIGHEELRGGGLTIPKR